MAKKYMEPLVAIAKAMWRHGDRVAARRSFETLLREWTQSCETDGGFNSQFASDDWPTLRQIQEPFETLVSAQAECGDIEGAMAATNAFSSPIMRCRGLVCVGSAQAQAGNSDAAWNLFLQAVEVSDYGDGPTTSVGDIAEGEIRLGSIVAAQVIVDHLEDGWLRGELQSKIQQRSERLLWIPDYSDFKRDGPIFLTNKEEKAEAYQIRRVWQFWNRAHMQPKWQLWNRSNAQRETISRLKRTLARAELMEREKTREYILAQVSLFYLEIGDLGHAIETVLTIPGEFDYFVFRRIVKIHTDLGNLDGALNVALKMRDGRDKVALLVELARVSIARSGENAGQPIFEIARQIASDLPRETWRSPAIFDVVIGLADTGFIDEAKQTYQEYLASDDAKRPSQ